MHVLPFAVYVGAHVIVSSAPVASSWPYLSESVDPFLNVHVMEEVAAGIADPLRDPLFLGFSAAIAILAFCLPSALAARMYRGKHRWRVWFPTGATLLLVVILRGYIVEQGYPLGLRAAFLAQLAAFLLAAAIGVWLGETRGAHARNRHAA